MTLKPGGTYYTREGREAVILYRNQRPKHNYRYVFVGAIWNPDERAWGVGAWTLNGSFIYGGENPNDLVGEVLVQSGFFSEMKQQLKW